MSEQLPSGPSVLLAFRAENVRSFRDEFELSMLATTLSEPEIVRDVQWREGGKLLRTLPVAGIFGANASGKTNVLRALDDMRDLVLWSFRHGDPTGGISQRPFQLDPAAERSPSSFEIELVLDGVRHEYGFKLDRRRVLEEWAFRYPRGRPALLFSRDGDDVELGGAERARGRAVRELLRPNALFLSTAASANHPLLLPLYEWFQRNLLLAEAGSRRARQLFTTRMLDDKERHEQVLALLRAADLGVTGASLEEMDPAMRERLERAVQILSGQEDLDSSEGGVDFERFEIRLAHRGAQSDVELDAADESLGTLVWFGLVGPVIDALADGSVLLADELDASLHPALVNQLVRLFQDPATNPRRAQLIFNSHDVTVMGNSKSDRRLGRDQIWFTEKLNDGTTRLYPLTELDPRKDEAVARRYLTGRYGGIPIIAPTEFDQAAELITSGTPRGT
jgi:hypothetical protein